MPLVKCKICKSEFYAKPNWLKIGYGKYCSRKCHHESQKNGRIVKCFICGKDTYRANKDLLKSKSKKYFCSKSCQTIWRNTIVFIGSNHSNWRGGESTYRNILIRNKISKSCKLCMIKDGRVLTAHHIDSNRKNNELNNLVWLCHNCHYLVHHDIKEGRKLMEILV